MDFSQIYQILTLIFGTTTLVSIYVAWKSRNAEIKKVKKDALDGMDELYSKFTDQSNKKFDEMQSIIDAQTEQIKLFKKLLSTKDNNDTILKNKITAQTKLITDNNNKIKGLEKTVNNYQKKCYQCIHNISKQESDKSNS